MKWWERLFIILALALVFGIVLWISVGFPPGGTIK
jgi:hypothetical protein